MKIKNLLSIPVMLLTLALAGCNGGTGSTNSASTNSVNLSNKLTSAENNGLLITNPSSTDINWGSDTLVNIPIGAKGLKGIKVTNTTNQPFNKLTLETSANKPQSITIDNDRTTCSMGIPLAANASCLYVFSYSPVSGYESGTFTATVSAEQAENNAKVSVGVDYSTRVSANAGTLSVNVDTSALNCTVTSCNGTLYVVNSKGAKVSTVVNITGNNGTIFGAGLVNLDPNDSYTIEASPINGSIPTYSPDKNVRLVADATTTVTVKYPAVPVSSGKAIITLPNVLPAYTGTLKMQILNAKNGKQVVDSEDLKQGDKAVVDLPVSDATHSYVVKLANGIADSASGLFYDAESNTPLEIKESGITNLSIPMAKATSLSNVTLAISGLQYESKTSSVTDTASVSFSDADNHYKYVNQYNQLSGYKIYTVKNGLNFTIQTQANGTNSYKVNPIVNTFNVDGAKSVVADFKVGANVVGRVTISLSNDVPNYTEPLPVQILNTKNDNQIVKEINMKQGETIVIDGLPVVDDSHDYVVKLPYGIADPSSGSGGSGFRYQCSPKSITVTNSPEPQLIFMSCAHNVYATKFTISGLQGNDTANVIFSGDGDFVKWKYVNSYSQTNGEKTYYLAHGGSLYGNETKFAPIVKSYTITTQANGSSNYQVNPIVNSYDPDTLVYNGGKANFVVEPLTYVGAFDSHKSTGQTAFTTDGKYMYSTTSIGTINRYNVGSDGSINYSGVFNGTSNNDTTGGLAIYPNGYIYTMTNGYNGYLVGKYGISSDGAVTYQGYTYTSAPVRAIATSTKSQTVYMSEGGTLKVYNLNLGALWSGITNVSGIAVNSDGSLLYVLGIGGGYRLFAYVVEPDGRLVTKYFDLNISYAASKIVVSPDKKHLYISDGSTVEVFDLNSSGVPSYVRSYNYPGNIAVSADSKYFYTTDTSWIRQYAIGG